ncbi:aminotransferase class V-fold PLP-dependent enzyme [Jatrophihabitans sp. DSM 45814]
MPTSTAGYFDAAAGLPIHPVALEALQMAAEDGWADPTKLTGPGRRSAVLLDAARETVAGIFAVRADEVIFVPSGTHALQLAVLGTLVGRARAGNRLVHSAVEHSSVLKAAEWYSTQRSDDPSSLIDIVGVDSFGRVDAADFVAVARRPGVAAAVLQAANHEVGTRQPVADVAAGLSESGVPLVVDATHDLIYGDPPLGAAVFTADARMWGGPPGVGVLVVRRGTRWVSPFPADEAESRRSAGVVSVPAALAAAAALRAFHEDRDGHATRLRLLIDQIRDGVTHLDGGVNATVAGVGGHELIVLGDPRDRLPHLMTFSTMYVDGEALLTALDREGFVVSSGSSCTSDTLTPSHVLVAMGALSSGNVRISLHPEVSQTDVDRFLAVLPRVLGALRAELPVSGPIEVASTPKSPSTDPLSTHPRSVDPVPADPVADASDGILVDSRGRRCPLPILDLARAWPALPVGGDITVLSDDPAAETDIEAWARMQGQEYLGSTPHRGGPTGESNGGESNGDESSTRAVPEAPVATAYRLRRRS